ncbi:TlpA family protein disulfide reductase [bacterium]|nr:TlpA family protein disulfide reductase [bacterium]
MPGSRTLFPRAGLSAVLAVAVLIAAVLAAAAVAAETFPAPPASIPAERFDLGAYSGKVVLMDFWASWCKPCRKSMPWLRTMQETFGGQGLVVVAVNLDKDPGKATAMMQELGTDVVIVTDPGGILAEAYKLEAIPSTFIYDRQGKLVSSHKGFDPDEAETRATELGTLVAGEGK